MTREESIRILKEIEIPMNGDNERERTEALEMAISALSENKCFDGMTNGEVIQALFPNISVYEHGSTYSVNNEYNFNSTWWNAPYQKGGE